MNALMILQVPDLGSALTAVQTSGFFPQVKVLDLVPLTTSAQVLLEGSTKDLVKVRKDLPTADLDKSVIIENPHPSLLKAYYHLETSELDGDLVIIEGDFVGYLLQTLDVCLKDGMKLIDFRQPKLSGAMSSVYLSCTDMDEYMSKKYLSSKVKFRWINNPNKALLDFFKFEQKN